MVVMITTTSFVSLFSRPQSHWFLKKTNTCRSFSTTHNRSNPPLYGTMTEWPSLVPVFKTITYIHTHFYWRLSFSLCFLSFPYFLLHPYQRPFRSFFLSFFLSPPMMKKMNDWGVLVYCALYTMPFTAVQVFLVLPRSKDSPFRLLLRPSTSHLPREIRRLRVWSVPTRDS